MSKRIPHRIIKVNRITDSIAKEYRKKTPNKQKIGRLASRAARLLRPIKRRK